MELVISFRYFISIMLERDVDSRLILLSTQWAYNRSRFIFI